MAVGASSLGHGDPVGATIACEEISWASAALGNIVSAIRITAFALDRFGGDASSGSGWRRSCAATARLVSP